MRRFATYKRGNLLREPQRLIKLLSNTETPVQFIFAGKAHPRDTAGKEIIRQLVHFASEHPEIRRRLLFLEDYDIDIARYMVQGVDVWLNNPRRPMEASGTSGMKAALNGVLNMSTLDGWWCEGYIPDGGWIIGAGEEYDDLAYQDQVESQAIFNLLEQEVALYFAQSERLPRADPPDEEHHQMVPPVNTSGWWPTIRGSFIPLPMSNGELTSDDSAWFVSWHSGK